MLHPFVPDLSDKNAEELQLKIAELTRNLNWAYRMQNSGMIHQLNMILENYRGAYYKKMDEQFSKQNLGEKIKVDK